MTERTYTFRHHVELKSFVLGATRVFQGFIGATNSNLFAGFKTNQFLSYNYMDPCTFSSVNTVET